MLLVALVMIPKILIAANTCSVARVSIISQYRYPLSRLSSLTLSFKLEFHALLGDCSRIVDTLLLVIMVVTIVVMVTSFVDGKETSFWKETRVKTLTLFIYLNRYSETCTQTGKIKLDCNLIGIVSQSDILL